jgi:hypothetical protein
VEQKNGMLVRRVVGYQRLEGLEAAQVLGDLYGLSCVNQVDSALHL